MKIQISSRTVVLRSLLVIIFLTVMHVILQIFRLWGGHDEVWGLTHMFNFDEEYNIPTVFSFLLFCIISYLAGVISYITEKNKGPYVLQWMGISLIFAFLGLDEIISLHEQWEVVLHVSLHTTGILRYIWQLPYVIFFMFIMAAYVPFWKNLKSSIRHAMTWSAVAYLMGVIVFETLGGWYFSNHGERNIIYMSFATAEEIMEMLGLTIFIYALLEYLRLEFSFLNIELKKNT